MADTSKKAESTGSRAHVQAVTKNKGSSSPGRRKGRGTELRLGGLEAADTHAQHSQFYDVGRKESFDADPSVFNE